LRLLHQVATDPEAATHARVTAARALITEGRRNEDRVDDAAQDVWPPLLVLPDNGRDPHLSPIGIHRDDRGLPWLLIYRNDEAGLADRDRWLEERGAEWLAAHPEALPAPEKPPAMTNAERQRRHRERVKQRLLNGPVLNSAPCD
jgi:hypothetical protein